MGRMVVPRMYEDMEEKGYEPPPKESSDGGEETFDMVKSEG